MERHWPEYEPLLFLKIFRDPHYRYLITKTTFFTRFRRNHLGKIKFFGKFLLIAEIYFGIFFLHNKFISETYFLTIKRFWKAAENLVDLSTIY
jgi:hypothetical protein